MKANERNARDFFPVKDGTYRPENGFSPGGKIIPKAGIFLLLLSLIFGACVKEKKSEAPAEENSGPGKSLVIWTYDSFSSEWGPGPGVTEAFENETGIKISWVTHSDAGGISSRLLLDKENAGADIILGLDQNFAVPVLESGLLEAYKPKGADTIFPELVLDPSFRLVPFDYSYFAIVYDSEKIENPPVSLEELTEPRFRESLILLDPRTSSPGQGFFGWIKEAYGNGWRDYWKRLSPSVLTVADGWSAGYGLFTSGEAPMVLSYTTSPGYHLEYEDTERYKTAIFSDGHPLQIEAAGLLKNSANKENAKAFLDFMISPAFQSIIPLTNWMYPVIDIPLPDSFRINPKSEKALNPAPVSEEELNEWASLMLEVSGN